MANRLCTLDPYAQIRNDYSKIETGFDRTATELDNHQAQITTVKEAMDEAYDTALVFANGILHQVVTTSGEEVVSTSTLTYINGRLTQVEDVEESGRTFITTLIYDADGNLSSVSKVEQ